jgi:hypothetical protein
MLFDILFLNKASDTGYDAREFMFCVPSVLRAKCSACQVHVEQGLQLGEKIAVSSYTIAVIENRYGAFHNDMAGESFTQSEWQKLWKSGVFVFLWKTLFLNVVVIW